MKRKNKIHLGVRLSELESVGAKLILGAPVQINLLSKKYEGDLLFAKNLYHVYVRYGFYSGARICGIALEHYSSEAEAQLACMRLNKICESSFKINYKIIRGKRRKRIVLDIVAHLITLVVAYLYIQRFFVVAEWGLDMASFILSIIYPVIAALCYIIHFRLQ